MPLRTCDILTYALYDGDATSQHTFELARVLAGCGIRPKVYSNYPPHDLPADIRPIAQQASYASFQPAADLTILQYPLWFPLAERFRTVPGARLFWYHGVTPPEQWPVAEEADLLRTSQVRTELANFAHLSVAASPFTAAELAGHSGIPSDRIRIVPLGVDIARFGTRPEPSFLAHLRARWGLQDRRVLVYVGRVAGNKRIDIAIDVLARLAPETPNLHLLVVGDNASGIATQVLVAQLRQRAQEQGVADRVTFTGRVPDVAPYYHLADAFVLPSLHEGFGVPIVEAMAAGTPVIASASGALPWLLGTDAAYDVRCGGDAAGLLFSPGDVEEASELLAELLARADLRRELVERGRRRAQEFDLRTFRTRAGLTMFAAMESHFAGEPVPEAKKSRSLLYRMADTIDRGASVRSRVPLLGALVARIRAASTVHLKEAYFDRVMEQQVTFNRCLAESIDALEVALQAEEANSKAFPPVVDRQ